MIRVVVAAKSARVRSSAVQVLEPDPALEVVGIARSCAELVAKAKRHQPDLIVMDVALYAEKEFAAPQEIMIEVPTPIVVLRPEAEVEDSPVEPGPARGAVAVLSLPSSGADAVKGHERFRAKLKALARVKVVRQWRRTTSTPAAPVVRADRFARLRNGPAKIVAIASSTGGPAALQHILCALPAEFPVPILIVQHVASGFDSTIVTWLDSVCPMPVKLAGHHERLRARTVYLGPDDHHFGLADRSRLALGHGAPIAGFRPSATHLFDSVATHFGADAVALILTGMGRDGVDGLHRIRAAGGTVIAQDEATSVVFGMPNMAVREGVVDALLPLDKIPALLAELVGCK